MTSYLLGRARRLSSIALVAVAISWSSGAEAMPFAPGIFCDTYPDAPACIGTLPACTYCHTSPPDRNVFGAQVAAALLPGHPRPLSEADFMGALAGALHAVEA